MSDVIVPAQTGAAIKLQLERPISLAADVVERRASEPMKAAPTMSMPPDLPTNRPWRLRFVV